MSEQPSGFFRFGSAQEGMDLMGKMTDVANPKSVFSEPVTRDNYQIITTTESITALGYGFGGGEALPPTGETPMTSAEGRPVQAGYGGGGGGGGYAMGRPVAVVVMGPNGVEVQPVVDITKIGIAFLTTIGAMMIAVGRMSRARRNFE